MTTLFAPTSVDTGVIDDLDTLTGDVAAVSFIPTVDLATAVLEAACAAAEGRGRLGIVYLLHFDRPYRHARHYTGWTTDPVAVTA
jgi:hypothetical protein